MVLGSANWCMGNCAAYTPQHLLQPTWPAAAPGCSCPAPSRPAAAAGARAARPAGQGPPRPAGGCAGAARPTCAGVESCQLGCWQFCFTRAHAADGARPGCSAAEVSARSLVLGTAVSSMSDGSIKCADVRSVGRQYAASVFYSMPAPPDELAQQVLGVAADGWPAEVADQLQQQL